MKELFELKELNFSPRIARTWDSQIEYSIKEIKNRFPDINPNEIHEEKFRILENKVGEIFESA